MRKLSQTGIELIKSFEGCRLTAYKPVPTENWYTIGFGHTGADVQAGAVITAEQAEALLVSDLARYEWYVNDEYHCPVTESLNQNQFDALTSFTYNCGNSNLRNLCNGRTVEQIAEHIQDFNKSSGTVLAGLVRRRKAEFDLFNLEVNEMDKADGKQIVAILGKYWHDMDGNKEVQDYTHYLANKVRLACGMKEDEDFE